MNANGNTAEVLAPESGTESMIPSKLKEVIDFCVALGGEWTFRGPDELGGYKAVRVMQKSEVAR